jgi:hypothetical protein
MSGPHSRLGTLSVLALSGPAFAADPGDAPAPTAVPYRLSYETEQKAGEIELKIYAQNQSSEVILIDDDPFVEAAWVQLQDGRDQRLNAGFDADMMSRAGPRRRWMAVKPGERLLVGTASLVPGTLEQRFENPAPVLPPLPTEGDISLKVRVILKDRADTVEGTLHLGKPNS